MGYMERHELKKKITNAKPPSPKGADVAYYLFALGARCMPTVEEPQRQKTHGKRLSLFPYATEIPASATPLPSGCLRDY